MHKFRGAVLAKRATCCPRAAPAMFWQRGQLPPLPPWLRRLCTRSPFLIFPHNQQYDTLLPIIPCTHKLKAGIANSRQVTLIAALMLIDQPYRQYYCYEALFRQWIVITFLIIVTNVNIEIVCFKVLFFIQPFFVVRIRCSSSKQDEERIRCSSCFVLSFLQLFIHDFYFVESTDEFGLCTPFYTNE